MQPGRESVVRAVQPGGGSGGSSSSSGLADVIDTILDKGLVIDAYIRVSLIGIELLTIDARIVVASVDTYLRFAEAVSRLDLSAEQEGLPGLVSGAKESGAKRVTKGVLEGVGRNSATSPNRETSARPAARAPGQRADPPPCGSLIPSWTRCAAFFLFLFLLFPSATCRSARMSARRRSGPSGRPGATVTARIERPQETARPSASNYNFK